MKTEMTRLIEYRTEIIRYLQDGDSEQSGKRPGAGRPTGSRNKPTFAREARAKALTELAREKTEDALAVLESIMTDAGVPEAAHVPAATALLDRSTARIRWIFRHPGRIGKARARPRSSAGKRQAVRSIGQACILESPLFSRIRREATADPEQRVLPSRERSGLNATSGRAAERLKKSQ